MALAPLVNRDFHRWFQGQAVYNGPQIPVANVDPTDPVTSALIAKAFWAGDKTAYQAGKRFSFIPVIPADSVGASVKLPTAADQMIYGVVVGAGAHTSAFTLENQSLDAINNGQFGNPKVLSLAPRGCGRIVISPYTGTAPSISPAAAVNIRKVGTSATAGCVETFSTDALADSFGCLVVAVDTTLGYCAYILGG